jgi:hypothetical protein
VGSPGYLLLLRTHNEQICGQWRLGEGNWPLRDIWRLERHRPKSRLKDLIIIFHDTACQHSFIIFFLIFAELGKFRIIKETSLHVNLFVCVSVTFLSTNDCQN